MKVDIHVYGCYKMHKTRKNGFSGKVFGSSFGCHCFGQNTYEFIMSLYFIFINNISRFCVLSVSVCR
jgi:hypothetical protein